MADKCRLRADAASPECGRVVDVVVRATTFRNDVWVPMCANHALKCLQDWATYWQKAPRD